MMRLARRATLLVAFSLLTTLTLVMMAQAETITASAEYQMGDNDSRNDARNICYLNAKRQALERAGVYIESQTAVRNLQVQRQDVTAFTAAIAKIEQAGDRVMPRGESQVVTCTVRITIDPQEMQARLQQFGQDKSLH